MEASGSPSLRNQVIRCRRSAMAAEMASKSTPRAASTAMEWQRSWMSFGFCSSLVLRASRRWTGHSLPPWPHPAASLDTAAPRSNPLHLLKFLETQVMADSSSRFGFVAFAETWNGRLAMLGFVIGLGTELLTGQGVLAQIGLG